MSGIGRELKFDFRGVPREWEHFGHTARVTEENELGDGTLDRVWTCECGGTWTVLVELIERENEDEEIDPPPTE